MTEDKRLDIAQKAQRWGRAYIQSSPLALSLREVNRLMAFALLAEQDKQERGEVMPVLDVGCGDGVWWMLQDVDRGLVYGVDISGSEIKRAQKHIHAVLADISKVRPFPEVSFPTVLANCSLEHVPDIQGALDTIRRCAIEKNGRLVLFVPAVQWGYQGMIQAFFLRHAPRLAMSLSGALNGFFQHWHLYDLSVWESILARSGWKIREVHGLGNARSEFLFRLFLPLSLPGFLFKSLFGVYPNRLLRFLPDIALEPASWLLEWALKDPMVSADSPDVYEYLIVAELAEQSPQDQREGA